MNTFVINISSVIGTALCIEAEDGQKIFELITKALKESTDVKLSFQNVEIVTSAFLNTAVGQLYRDFPEEEIKKRLSVEHMLPEDMALLKRVTTTAKLYYKDPESMERSMKEMLEE